MHACKLVEAGTQHISVHADMCACAHTMKLFTTCCTCVRMCFTSCSGAHSRMQGAAILLPGMPLCVPHRQEGEAAAWSVIISCIARGRVPHLPQGRHCALLGMDAMHVLASAYSMPTHGWHGGVVARHRCNVHEDVTAAAMWLLLLCCYCHVIATATWFLLPCGATAMLLLPYMQITKKVTLHKKAVDDVLGGEDAWKNVAKTDGTYSCLCVCPPAFHYLPCACSEHDWLHIHTPLSCTYAALRTCSAADSTTPPVSTLNYIHPVPTPLLPASPHLSHFPPLLSLPPPLCPQPSAPSATASRRTSWRSRRAAQTSPPPCSSSAWSAARGGRRGEDAGSGKLSRALWRFLTQIGVPF